MKTLQTVTIVLFCLTLLLFCGVMLYDRLFVDTTPPEIWCSTPEIVVSVSDPQSALLAGVVAEDDRDGDLTDRIMIKNVSQLITDNTARVTYIVFDSADNMATLSRTVQYRDYEKPRFSLEQPLNFTPEESMRVLDRLHAQDVLDGDISDSICVVSQNILSEPGVYRITVQATNSLGDTATVPLKLVVRESGVRELICLRTYLLYLPQGTAFDPQQYLLSACAPDGSALPDDTVQIENPVDPLTPGAYHVRYEVTSHGQSYAVYLTVVVY